MASWKRFLEDISFEAGDRAGETVTVDGSYVQQRMADVKHSNDINRFIL